MARIVSRLLPDGEIIEAAYPIAGTPAASVNKGS
jgi:hypothetical protein